MGVKVTFVSLLALGLFLVPCLSLPPTERPGIDDKDLVLTTDKTATTAADRADVPQKSDVPAEVTSTSPKPSDGPGTDKTTDVPTSPKTTPSTPTTPTPDPTTTPLTTITTPSTTSSTTSAPTTTATATPEPTPSSSSTSPAAPITPTPSPSGGGNQFNGWSFFGGILLTLLLAAIGFVGFKYYKLRSGTGGRYNTF